MSLLEQVFASGGDDPIINTLELCNGHLLRMLNSPAILGRV